MSDLVAAAVHNASGWDAKRQSGMEPAAWKMNVERGREQSVRPQCLSLPDEMKRCPYISPNAFDFCRLIDGIAVHFREPKTMHAPQGRDK